MSRRRNQRRDFEPDRRRLLAWLAGLPLAGSGLALGETRPATAPSRRTAPARSLVARGRREGLVKDKGQLDTAKLDELLAAALSKATGSESPAAAMRKLFRPSDVVGLKLNSLAGRGLAPHPQLVARLCDWLQEAGVPARQIVVWDRTDRELIKAGFEIVRSGSRVRCLGTENDYDWKPREWGPGASCFARLLVEELTALINVGVLKDHDLAGVSIGLKNWYGVIHNPNKHHADGCAPYIPHLAAYPLIRDKLRLTVIDASTAQCHGGPARSPRWSWPWQGVMASTDPVAIEVVGWQMIETRRREVKLPSLGDEKREPVWIAEAGQLGLGEADLERIEVADL